ncbi:MAG: HEPN domain-containing protein [Chitinivibrionales bacterium]|nr:HEPN domain-containing protein [Chitinivibrionales bacterium]
MTEGDYHAIIARQWMGKSRTALKTADVLFKEKLLVGCVNRLYYAVFYAVSAALAKQGKEYGKHTAIRAALHRDFVKPGLVPASCSKIYNRLFNDRQEGDYKPETTFKEDEIEELIDQTRQFLDLFQQLVEK